MDDVLAGLTEPDDTAQQQPEPPLVEVATTSRGYTLYRRANGAGGHSYLSDSIGGGVVIYDTCLASPEELMLALQIEAEYQAGVRK